MASVLAAQARVPQRGAGRSARAPSGSQSSARSLQVRSNIFYPCCSPFVRAAAGLGFLSGLLVLGHS